jgi:hypothetical protein
MHVGPQDHSAEFIGLLEAAAALQDRVPGAVMVGGSAAAVHARHRMSFDHDHVLSDLTQRYDIVLEAVEASEGWATSMRGTPPLTILGMEAGFEAGIRQLRRTRPLETERVVLPSGRQLVVPTAEEPLRVKAYLVVARNRVRDYLDVAALGDRIGVADAGAILRGIDEYYAERTGNDAAVSTVLAERLVSTEPRDTTALRDLPRYKSLSPRWHDWQEVARVCRELAEAMTC